MLFAVSVHNAASGLVSISTKNRAFTTSVAADYDTPAMALMEAIDRQPRPGGACGPGVRRRRVAAEGLVPEPAGLRDPGRGGGRRRQPRSPSIVRPSPSCRGFEMGSRQRAPSTNRSRPSVWLETRRLACSRSINAVIRRPIMGGITLDRGEGSRWSVEVRRGGMTGDVTAHSADSRPHPPSSRRWCGWTSSLEWSPGFARCSGHAFGTDTAFVTDGMASIRSALLEYMAQAVAACLGYGALKSGEDIRVGMIVACRTFEMHVEKVPIGAELLVEARRLREVDAVSNFECRVDHHDHCVATALMTLYHASEPPT